MEGNGGNSMKLFLQEHPKDNNMIEFYDSQEKQYLVAVVHKDFLSTNIVEAVEENESAEVSMEVIE